VDENLRWGPHYHPWEPETHFAFAADRGSMAFAADRCVGTGKCRKHDAGTMCPSYMATRDEMHSTRGRSRLLFEMLEGNPLRDGWRDRTVKDSLDLCLACKGCKGECPVNVDMATYKAEFLSHYYHGRLRPVAAYAFGLMPLWARAAARLPRVVNVVTHAPLLRSIAKAAVTMAPQRHVPRFARETFTHWFASRVPRVTDGPPVLLWPDTWNNHFHPDTARAAVRVLEAAGFRVLVPAEPLCCGRPLYDYGMLGLARRWLEKLLAAMAPYAGDGVPVVGLEPSCVSVFRDEMADLLHGDERAKALAGRTFLLSDFLVQKAPHFAPPPLAGKALVHGHCHHKSVLGFDAEEEMIARTGLEYTVLDSGCCGMAGAFGFEKGEHYDVSIRCGERVLLPAVRSASADTLVMADGYSCREQIAQTTTRHALHLAEVLAMALDGGTRSMQ
jgi:Fe-S oxidoreductase